MDGQIRVSKLAATSSRWGTLFADDKLATPSWSASCTTGRLVEFKGPSHRLKQSLMLNKSGK